MISICSFVKNSNQKFDQKLQVTSGTSTNAIKKFMTHQRSVLGRDSVEPNIMDKLREANQELANFFKEPVHYACATGLINDALVSIFENKWNDLDLIFFS